MNANLYEESIQMSNKQKNTYKPVETDNVKDSDITMGEVADVAAEESGEVAVAAAAGVDSADVAASTADVAVSASTAEVAVAASAANVAVTASAANVAVVEPIAEVKPVAPVKEEPKASVAQKVEVKSLETEVRASTRRMFQAYCDSMAPNKQVSIDEILVHQKELLAAIQYVLRQREGAFHDALRTAIEVVRANRRVFSPYLAYRGLDRAKFAKDKMALLKNFINLLATAADVQSPKDVRKQVNLQMIYVLIDGAAQELLESYFA